MRVLSLQHTPIALAVLLALGAGESFAQPVSTQLPVLRPGGALINARVGAPSGNALTVTQTTSANNRGLVEWSSFSIGSAARVNIVQPNAQSVLVNRVMGTGTSGPSASEIYGSLSANGKVFLVNPSGVVFGPGAQVNVGSLVATSLDLDNSMTANNYDGLMRGNEVRLNQAGTGNGTGIEVMAADDPRRPQIQVTEGGSIVLISHDQVVQNGAISAPGGHVNLSTGSAATLLPVGNSGYVEVSTVQPSEVRTGGVALGLNSQTLASGGSIVIGGQPNEKGSRGDTITVAGVVSTDSSVGNAGSVHIDGGANGSVVAREAAVISSSSTGPAGTGGSVTLLGGSITLQRGDVASPRVLAEGSAGGGRIVVGDENTRAIQIEERTTLSTDATQTGNGGTIAVRAMYVNPISTTPVARVDYGVTEVYGTLQSRGGTQGGNGGNIETSGIALNTSLTNAATGVTRSATVDARARAAGGQAGNWTLDPFDVTISSGAPVAVNGAFNPTGPGANVQASDLSAALNAGTNVDISTEAGGAGTAAGNITIAAGTTITRTAGTATTSLTLRANNNIVVNGATIDASAAGPVNVNLYADIDGNGTGNIGVIGSTIQTGGGNLTLSGGTTPSTGFARGDAQNAAVDINRSTIDTRSLTTPGLRGDLVVRGQAAALPGALPAVNLGSNLIVGNLSVEGRASHGTAVSLGGTTITTTTGTIDVRGITTRVDTTTAPLIGVDTGIVSVQLGTGSLTLAGRGDDAGLSTSGNATGLRVGDLRISADAASTGRITLAGQSAGAPFGQGIASTFSTGTLIISSNALAAGNAATGASVVIGGMSDAARGAIDLGASSVAPNIASSSGVNLRPLGVSNTGAITELTTEAIWIGTPTGAPTGVRFLVDRNWLRVPNGNGGGISGGQGVVVGSSAHTGLITLESNVLTTHGTASLTLQNQGTGSAGITLGGGNTIGSLALMSAGNITQSGALTVQNLALEGGGASNFNLSNTGNLFGRVAFDPPATLSLFTAGDLTVDAVTAQGFNATTGSFTPLAIAGSVGGNTALLQSAANVFINRSISMAGTGASQLNIVSPGSVTFATGAALSTGAAGRWRVWAPTVVNAPFAGPATNLYGCVFGDTTTCSVSSIAIPTAGNQLLHPTQPTITVAANPTTGYLDLALPTLTFTTTGLLNGDTPGVALAGTLGTTPTGATTYAIGQGSLRSPLGYNLTFLPSTLSLQPGITRHMLQAAFKAEMASDVYGRNLDQPYICTAASVIRGSLADDKQSDPLASEWGKVRNQPQLSGCLNVTDGGSCSAF
ncbi:MAG: filamentous hemagglutinin N-terminal domain-containing protein [Cytophagales bacterium]|nr:filamentous hemagglutinin N-terminal domain-containing protein [Rhizobacter sp.]